MSNFPGTWSAADLIRQRERILLAPYAMFSSDTAGRKHAEPDHPYRGPFQRDRDRILHSAAFRRLSGKMQVFTGDHGDYHRTRLTHTMEVASVARTMGRAMRLNEDLVEALALLHDIGHPPFGHAGEDALAELLSDEGGFSHNEFALTLIEYLECRYPRFPGLNLTHEVLESQTTRAHKADQERRPLLEAQTVDVADSITYNAHDVDDALKLGILTVEDFYEVSLGEECIQRVRVRRPGLPQEMMRQALVHELIDFQVGEVLRRCGPFLQESNWESADEARHSGFVVGPDEALAGRKAALERFLYERVYRHPDIMRVREDAQQRVRELMAYFSKHTDQLPPEFQRRADHVGPRRAAADYIAGMTDRFCLQQYAERVTAS